MYIDQFNIIVGSNVFGIYKSKDTTALAEVPLLVGSSIIRNTDILA